MSPLRLSCIRDRDAVAVATALALHSHESQCAVAAPDEAQICGYLVSFVHEVLCVGIFRVDLLILGIVGLLPLSEIRSCTVPLVIHL